MFYDQEYTREMARASDARSAALLDAAYEVERVRAILGDLAEALRDRKEYASEGGPRTVRVPGPPDGFHVWVAAIGDVAEALYALVVAQTPYRY